MNVLPEILGAIPALIRLAADAIEGKINSPGDVARSLVGLGLALVPHDELQRYLTEAGVERGEFAADLAESEKFGPAPLDDDEPDTGDRKTPR